MFKITLNRVQSFLFFQRTLVYDNREYHVHVVVQHRKERDKNSVKLITVLKK